MVLKLTKKLWKQRLNMKLSKIDRLVLEAGRKKKWVRYCPKCKSTDVALYGQLVETGFWYYCRKCFYHASSFPEKARK